MNKFILFILIIISYTASASAKPNFYSDIDEQNQGRNSYSSTLDYNDQNERDLMNSTSTKPYPYKQNGYNENQQYYTNLPSEKSSFYAGLDIQNQILDLKPSMPINYDDINLYSTSRNYQNKSINPNFFIGYNPNKNIDIEIGYSFSDEEKINDTGKIYTTLGSLGFKKYKLSYKSIIKTQNISFDFKPSYKINQNNFLYVIMGFNVMYLKLRESTILDHEESDITNYKTKTLAPTIGYGYKLNVGNDFSARAQFKYSYYNNEIGSNSFLTLKSSTQFSLGIAYNF